MNCHRITTLENLKVRLNGIVYNEQWKPVIGYERIYQISSFGRVKRLKYRLKTTLAVIPDKIILPSVSKYLKVSLRKNSKPTTFSIHRLVGIHFLERIEGKPHINHKTGIKTDNHYTQLEWCTPQENNEHGYRMGLLKKGRKPPKPYIKRGYANCVHYKPIIDLNTGIFYTVQELSVLIGKKPKMVYRLLSEEIKPNTTQYRYA